MYEYNDIKEDGELTLNKQIKYLNDSDDLWVKFKNTHIAEVHVSMIQEVQKLAQESKNYNSNSEDLSL